MRLSHHSILFIFLLKSLNQINHSVGFGSLVPNSARSPSVNIGVALQKGIGLNIFIFQCCEAIFAKMDSECELTATATQTIEKLRKARKSLVPLCLGVWQREHPSSLDRFPWEPRLRDFSGSGQVGTSFRFLHRRE
uniref:Uncharacterized protein n=1 Tax=Anguilla anguilla TaxID=7936 RepID=A0A0E9WEH4_ANGAN